MQPSQVSMSSHAFPFQHLLSFSQKDKLLLHHMQSFNSKIVFILKFRKAQTQQHLFTSLISTQHSLMWQIFPRRGLGKPSWGIPHPCVGAITAAKVATRPPAAPEFALLTDALCKAAIGLNSNNNHWQNS